MINTTTGLQGLINRKVDQVWDAYTQYTTACKATNTKPTTMKRWIESGCSLPTTNRKDQHR